MERQLQLPVAIRLLADNEIPECPGLYSLECAGRYYVGSTQNLRARYRRHRHLVNSGTHYNEGFQEAASLDGFVFRILQYYDTLSVPAQYCTEQTMLYAFSEEGLPLFNISPYARGGGGALSEQGRKVLQAVGARPKSKQTREKLANSRKGLGLPQHTCLKISLSLQGNTRAKGLVHSAEARRQMSISHSRVHSIKGDIYTASGEILRKLDIPKSTLSRRLHSKTPQFADYLLVSPEGFLYKPICLREHWRKTK